LATVAPDWQNWTKDPTVLENARIQLGQKLDQLAGGSGNSTSGTLPAPSVVWPGNGSAGNTVSLNLQWSTVSGATQYLVYLGSSATSLSLYSTVNAPGVSTAVYNLNAGTTYYWQVAAVSGNAATTSAVWSFTIAGTSSQTLSAATVVWPGNGSTGNTASLNLQWAPVSGATQYQVYFGSSSTSLALYSTLNAPVVNAAVYNLNGGTTYYWQVVATEGSISATSPIFSFTTAETTTINLSAPGVVWPANGSTSNTTSLNVQWSPISGAAQYQVYFGSSPSSLSLYGTFDAPGVNAAFYNLNNGTTYYWEVVAVAGTSSSSSPVWSFTTQ